MELKISCDRHVPYNNNNNNLYYLDNNVNNDHRDGSGLLLSEIKNRC